MFERLSRERLRREQVQEARLALPPRRPEALVHGPRDHRAHHEGDDQEGDDGDDVVAVVHAERVQRLREEVVEREEPEHRAPHPRPDPADHRRRDDGEEEQRNGAQLAFRLDDQAHPERGRRA